MEERAKKSFNITALKEWEEAGEPFEEDDVILAYLEYKRNEARKNGANPGTEPEDITLSMAENKHLEKQKRLLVDNIGSSNHGKTKDSFIFSFKNKNNLMIQFRVNVKIWIVCALWFSSTADPYFSYDIHASFNSRTYAYATTAVNNLQSSPPIMIAFSQTKAALPPSRQTLAAVTKKKQFNFIIRDGNLLFLFYK
ncbi:hypothetical protein GLOIN_2v1763873 [Rhizophagus irregularis DAOM 181602=DAOM 197198]|uniref:Uncharacterized protein n=1 Tax=Rhizophagus irregularis (strain DAOM 181602 / DAOM 197198 / MUCL 43194) TaxID=747089 RepID=A0A2P4QTG3_RHIID|nr:hypothetical protein GLOIN_2v1763873 [Rhizophagus irregularis DAOM 181602=DAOM 197198]POG80931.1 hypothetical protein GLOIN_2v1763873 [Rhizophagus irregularis DAOM 181602=DAOM 197198]|eukprot:XP_025187797.1 hypothetical protein GLOIN_2v1763873 [Rhizophagus irregularis DAOM 181602=DAOM 197198]